MRLGYVARYVPTDVKIYPDADEIVEHGGRVSLEKYGTVLVSGEDNYDFNRKAKVDLSGNSFKSLK